MKKNLLVISSFLLLSLVGKAQTWVTQDDNFVANAGVNDIEPVDESTVWITNYDGSGGNINYIGFGKTVDGGTTWTTGSVGSDTTYQFSNISAVDANTAWVCMFNHVAGAGGGIWKTTDGGTTWNQQAVGLIFNATSFPDIVHYWDANNGVAIGDPNGGYFEIYTTTDGGATYTRVPQANIPANGGTEYGVVNEYDVVGDNIWFATNTGRVYHSTDKGYHWTVATVQAVSTARYMHTRFLDANNGLSVIATAATGAFVAARRSTDGGATWTAIATHTGNFWTLDLGKIPGSNIMVSTGAAPNLSGSSYTTDLGSTWTNIDSAVQHTAFGSHSYTATWSGGFSGGPLTGGIFKLDPGTLGLPSNSVDLHSVSVYPNPTNGILNLNFKVKNSDVNVMIFDMVGNLVKNYTFANYNGIFTKTLDCSNLAKGIYNVVVETGAEKFNNKVVVQ